MDEKKNETNLKGHMQKKTLLQKAPFNRINLSALSVFCEYASFKNAKPFEY